jgi:hypothetical protein
VYPCTEFKNLCILPKILYHFVWFSQQSSFPLHAVRDYCLLRTHIFMHDKNWTVAHYPHELQGSLRCFVNLQYCVNDLCFNIILKICILFVLNGGERYRKFDLWFRRRWKISPNNWKVKLCTCGTAEGFKLFTETCRFQFVAVDRVRAPISETSCIVWLLYMCHSVQTR